MIRKTEHGEERKERWNDSLQEPGAAG